MLQHFSWFAYATLIITAALIYYGFIFLIYYRVELTGILHRFSGKTETLQSGGDLALPVSSILGATRQDGVEIINREELSFAPEAETELMVDRDDNLNVPANDVHLLGDLSEMISETKTLIRVINESSESKENFEMLFKLIIQKYPELIGTPYEDQVSHFLMNAGAEHFPFSLTLNELKTYWSTEQNLQSA